MRRYVVERKAKPERIGWPRQSLGGILLTYYKLSRDKSIKRTSGPKGRETRRRRKRTNEHGARGKPATHMGSSGATTTMDSTPDAEGTGPGTGAGTSTGPSTGGTCTRAESSARPGSRELSGSGTGGGGGAAGGKGHAAASERVNPRMEPASERRRANVTAWRAKLTKEEADQENSEERERGREEPVWRDTSSSRA